MTKSKVFKYSILIILILLSLILSLQGVMSSFALTNHYFDNITAKSYVIIDSKNNKILFEKNSNDKLPVASICKLMTTLLVLEKIETGQLKLDDKFVASEYACSVEGSQAFLDSGCEYLVRDLVKSIIVASANDSAIVVAENLAGNEKNFTEMMNTRAKELGMLSTIYANSTGLTEGEQFSTAFDTALLLKELQKYPLYLEDSHIWMDELVHPSGRKTELVNTNRLIRYYNNCISGKTGFTDESGYCLASMSKKDDLTLTCVVLGCTNPADRFKESIELYNYAFANYKSKKVISATEPLNLEVKINNGKKSKLAVSYCNDVYITEMINVNKNIEIKYNLPKTLKAPIKTGDKIGVCYIIYAGEIIDTVDIVSMENVDKQGYLDIISKIGTNWNINFVNK